jgi:hypothetical protein
MSVETVVELVPKQARWPLLFVAIAATVLTGWWRIEARAEEVAERTTKATVNTEVIQQLRIEAKNAASEAAKDAASQAVKEVGRDAAADREFMLRKQAQLEVRFKELEEEVKKKK